MPDFPDVYADGAVISASAYGITVTLTVSEPTGKPGMEASPSRTVARIRMSSPLAAFVAETLRQAIANQPKASPQESSSKSVS